MAKNPKPLRRWYRKFYGLPPKDHKRRGRQDLRRLYCQALRAGMPRQK